MGWGTCAIFGWGLGWGIVGGMDGVGGVASHMDWDTDPSSLLQLLGSLGHEF